MSLAEPVTTGQARRPGVLAGGLDATALELRTPQTTGTARSWACRHTRGRGTVNFAGICQPWLKEAVKSWCRWRLGNGGAFGTVSRRCWRSGVRVTAHQLRHTYGTRLINAGVPQFIVSASLATPQPRDGLCVCPAARLDRRAAGSSVTKRPGSTSKGSCFPMTPRRKLLKRNG